MRRNSIIYSVAIALILMMGAVARTEAQSFYVLQTESPVPPPFQLSSMLRVDAVTGNREVVYESDFDYFGWIDIAQTPDCKFILAKADNAKYGWTSISEYNPATGESRSIYSDMGLTRVGPVTVGPDGTIYMLSPGPGDWKVVSVNPETGDLTVISDATTGTGPQFVELGKIDYAPDGYLVVTGQGLYDDTMTSVIPQPVIFKVDLATGNRSIIKTFDPYYYAFPDRHEHVTVGPDNTIYTIIVSRMSLHIIAVDPDTGDFMIIASGGPGPPGGVEIGQVRDIALDTQGRLYTVDHTFDRLIRIDPATGDRTIISDAMTGTGRNMVDPIAIVFASPPELLVHRDMLESPWINASWSVNAAFASTEKMYNGYPVIKVEETAPWGALSTHYGPWGSSMNVDPCYRYLNFAVCTTDEPIRIDAGFENSAGDRFPFIQYGTITPEDGWVMVSLPVNLMNPDGKPFNRVDIRETLAFGRTYYIADVHFSTGTGMPPEPPEDGAVVYGDRLMPPWIDASWNAGVDYANTGKVFDGDKAIRVDAGAWGALSMHYGKWTDSQSVMEAYLTFAVAADGVTITPEVWAENDYGDRFSGVPVGTVAPSDGWVEAAVAMTELNPDGHEVHRLVFRNRTGQAATFYVDEVVLTDTMPTMTRRLTAAEAPAEVRLGVAVPNPFNPSTTIAFELPAAAHVRLTVYNLLGQEVIRLVDTQMTAGRHMATWNGRNASGYEVASGVYLYRLTTDKGFVETRQMTLLK